MKSLYILVSEDGVILELREIGRWTMVSPIQALAIALSGVRVVILNESIPF